MANEQFCVAGFCFGGRGSLKKTYEEEELHTQTKKYAKRHTHGAGEKYNSDAGERKTAVR